MTVSRATASASKALNAEIVPAILGFKHISVEKLIQQYITTISKELLTEGDDVPSCRWNLALHPDYSKIGASYPEACPLTNLEDVLKWVDEKDILMLDRGFRDCVDVIEALSLDVVMLSFLHSQKQLETSEATKLRFVTKIRWIVESVLEEMLLSGSEPCGTRCYTSKCQICLNNSIIYNRDQQTPPCISLDTHIFSNLIRRLLRRPIIPDELLPCGSTQYFNPQTETCFKHVYNYTVCKLGHHLCGRTQCFNPTNYTCVNNTILNKPNCQWKLKLCGVECYDPKLQVCINNSVLCPPGHKACGNKYCYRL
ncbi:unnamed protein product [Didymodactylos carnosus]|uniref:Uncharacterized protein n=1 Tax=Didymodactylos carnosus TaxID=1234261 RepID=A0A8S2EKW0_9BILA|nr:unnamed protein product [Didymodactylos carnosus]CAF3986347.1 unnamed protein product [Didymodactylos carnosus]